MSYLSIQDLSVSYAKGSVAVANLNLAVERGELISLLGPSGCGKTTTMRAVAGLLTPSAGKIVLDGADITQLTPNKRDLGLVFQSYALFPHLTCFDNVAFGLRLRKLAQAELRTRVAEAIESVGLTGFEQRLPAQLSGGQQQRVALARAMVIRPRLLLLDEPLSNLDAKLRIEMRAQLRRIQRELGITMLYVTHDQDEALSLSDRVVVMRAGKIEQCAAPEAVFSSPATPFVASFMGYDNFFTLAEGQIQAENAERFGAFKSKAKHLAWRPESVAVTKPRDAPHDTPRDVLQGTQLAGIVLARSFLGETVQYLVRTRLGDIKGSAAAADALWLEGDAVSVLLDEAKAAAIDV